MPARSRPETVPTPRGLVIPAAVAAIGAAALAAKGGDRGIDGRLYFHEGAGDTRQIVFSVKGGEHLVPTFVRDLRGVIERENAEIGVLISFEEPTAGMRAEGDAHQGPAQPAPFLPRSSETPVRQE